MVISSYWRYNAQEMFNAVLRHEITVVWRSPLKRKRAAGAAGNLVISVCWRKKGEAFTGIVNDQRYGIHAANPIISNLTISLYPDRGRSYGLLDASILCL